MAPVDWSWGEAYSPTVLAPSHPTNDFNTLPANALPAQDATIDFAPQWQPPTNNTHSSTSAKPHHKTSRKRSRDEMGEGYENDDSDSSHPSTTRFPSARPTPSPPKREFNALASADMMNAYASSVDDDMQMMGSQLDGQTGMWAEELSERLRSSSMREQMLNQQRPALEARKSMRLDRPDDDTSAQGAPSPGSAIREMITDDAAKAPDIDEAALTLGIGWSSMPSSLTMDAAARGWARHIESHFPLTSVRIVWMNKSLPAYLVSAVTTDLSSSQSVHSQFGRTADSPASPWSGNRAGTPGYYLFDEQLNQGRLVAKSWVRAIQNLRRAPLAFDGETVMESTQIAPVPKPIQAKYWAGWGMRTGIGANSSTSTSNAAAVAPPPVSAMVEAAGGGDSMDVDM